MISLAIGKKTPPLSEIQYNGRVYEIADGKSRADILQLRSEVKKLVEQQNDVPLQFLTHFDFPNIGESDKLYIATDENKIYRFDSETLSYNCVVGNTFDEIELIQISLNE